MGEIFPGGFDTTTSAERHCTAFTLPSIGFISVNPTSTITLTSNVVFVPNCTPTSANSSLNATDDGLSNVADSQAPFHASVTPQVYATGAATVLAWMLVIMLLITPRTFFVGGAGGTITGLRGRRGLISGASGGASVIGVGSRPWLQKVAALTVAISLTIASVDTFRVAERQYNSGVMDADLLRDEVVGSLSIRISRVISDIFLWLAQIQTLIRLFPRHKEKVLIKWIGFALVILDATFSCLNTFISRAPSHDRRFREALPALSYLFQLALSMLYAAWVIYYALIKRRYAFYHKMMWNISLVALLSIVAILTPVVFFITDISNTTVAGWGDYFRWVGAAAASVIVWEWVERIEALEREEKKDGILGREVFDGDEMLDLTPPAEVVWPGRRTRRGGGGWAGRAYASGLHGRTFLSDRMDRFRHSSPFHYRRKHEITISDEGTSPAEITEGGKSPEPGEVSVTTTPKSVAPLLTAPPPPPAPIASPVSRSDTTSAASTIYAVRYYPATQPSPPIARQQQRQLDRSLASRSQPLQLHEEQPDLEDYIAQTVDESAVSEVGADEHIRDSMDGRRAGHPTGFSLPNPFKRRKASPPAEVRGAQVIEPLGLGSRATGHVELNRWDFRSRFGAFAAEQADRFKDREKTSDVDLPVTIIPAQRRGRTWSPEDPVVTAQNKMSELSEELPPSPGQMAEGAGAPAQFPPTSTTALPQQQQTSRQRTGFVPSASDIRPLPAGTRIPASVRAPAPSAPVDMGRPTHTPPPTSPSLPEDGSKRH